MLTGEIWFEGYCREDGFDPASDAEGGFDGLDRCLIDELIEECGACYDEGEEPSAKPETPAKKRGERNKALGKRGEEAAARYLEHIGYEIVERNWKCRFGEADIIARDGDTLVFVEVKTRKRIDKGFPAEAVTPKKQAKYEKIAACYLGQCWETDMHLRFDVISLLVVNEDRAMVKHYVNAFGQGQ